MDRNTLTGLVLMAAILFGFMYLNKPDATQNMEADVAHMEQTAEKAAPAAATTDTITPADLASLREAILSAGTVQPDGSHRLTTAAVDLTVDSAAAVAGTIHAGKPTGDVSFADLAAGAASLGPDDRRMALETLRKAVADAHKYKAFAGKLGGENVEKVMENDLMRVTFSSRGGRVSQVELKNYKTELTTPETPIRLFRNESDGYSFVLTTADQRLNTSEFNFTPVAESDTSMLMKLELADGAWWGIRYSMQPGSYLVRMQVVQEGMASVLPASTATMGFRWHQTLGRNEKGRTFEERNSSIRYKYAGEGPEELSSSKDDSEELTGRVRWVAFTNQFFSSVLMAKDYFSAVRLDSKVLKEADWLKDMDAAAELPYSVADGAAADIIGCDNSKVCKSR